MQDAETLIKTLRLNPHPEGGWYRQTWVADDGPRPSGTAIYFLLKEGESSHWHRVDAVEIWHFYAGAPLVLRLAESEAGPAVSHTLGSELNNNMAPQVIVPREHWQAAHTTGAWSLVGCTVSPGFQFEGFELAPEGFGIT